MLHPCFFIILTIYKDKAQTNQQGKTKFEIDIHMNKLTSKVKIITYQVFSERVQTGVGQGKKDGG